METYNDDFRESTFVVEEVSYTEDATENRGDAGLALPLRDYLMVMVMT
jgi:hypothetical protein